MSLRRVLHPWFDDPLVHAIRTACLEQGADSIKYGGGRTDAWTDVRIEPRPDGELPWITGPRMLRIDDAQAVRNHSLMLDLLRHKGIEERFISAVTRFEIEIGRDSMTFAFEVGKDRFRIGSETRAPEADPVCWLTGGGIYLSAVQPLTATEEAEAGGARAYLVSQFESRPIRKAFLSYALDEERVLSNHLQSVDLADFQLNQEYTP